MLKFALVGCGRAAVRHAELLAGEHVRGATLAAVCDIVPERARELALRHGVPWFTDVHEMAARVEVDVFSVVTPSGHHAEHVIALAPYGKHVVVEKPMALRLDDADEMIRACERSNVRLFVVKPLRFHRVVSTLHDAIERGRFGKLVMATARVRTCRTQKYYEHDAWRGTWALDGGVIANQASHHIDLLAWLGGPIDSVFAHTTTALVDIEVEDTAVAVLRFENGALGVVEATTAARPTDLESSISILGERGAVEIGGRAIDELKTWRFVDSEPADDRLRAELTGGAPRLAGSGLHAYYEHVVRCVHHGAAPLVDGAEARRSLEVITAIYQSAATHREISLRVPPQHARLGRRA